MQIRHLREADYRRMRWKNGGGWTTELAAAKSTGSAAEFDWRISIAEIERDGAFSTFAQCDRLIALLDGRGMRLHFDAAPTAVLDHPLRFVPFCGDWQTFGQLIDGPVRDFNVIARRDLFRIEALHRPLVGSMLFPAEAAVTWLIYLVAGQAQIRMDATRIGLAAGESLLLEPDERARHAVLEGGGELLLIKLSARNASQSDGTGCPHH
jgi:environmental stress-induced protein Ves